MSRGGAFGGVGVTGPFHTNSGGFSQYDIAGSALNVASLDKYVAQTAWTNGTITDAQYLKALQKYLGATAEGSRERVSAQNELSDATYSVGRNKFVRQVNNALSPGQRVRHEQDLIAYDLAHLGSMKADNEQYRELLDRINDTRMDIRATRYNALQQKWNNGQLSTDALLSYATSARAQAKGQKDEQDWQKTVTGLLDQKSNETFNKLYQDYQMGRTPGATVISFLDRKLAGLNPNSPKYAEAARQREDLAKQVGSKERGDRDALMTSKHQQGQITDAQYLTYLAERVNLEAKGTPEYRQARTNLQSETFRLAEDRIKFDMTTNGTGPQQLIDLYGAKLSTMVPGSQAYRDISQQITSLRLQGQQGLDLFGGGSLYTSNPSGAPTGYWITPGGTPANNVGFASQFDGSPFASKNCQAAAAAMLAWAVTGGDTKVSGGDMRYYSGDTAKGDTNGVDPGGVVAAFKALGLGANSHFGMSLDAFRRNVANGKPAVLDGWYGNVPSQYSLSSSFDAGHAVFVQDAKKVNGQWFYYVKDPLGRAGYSGQWWPEEVVRSFGFSGTNGFNGITIFAGKTDSRVAGDPGKVPFQAFDTDYNGRDTRQHGGGTNRQEAGAPQDWSKGKPQPQTTVKGTDDISVDSFLSAVKNVAGQANQASSLTPEQEHAKAKALMGEFDGDARLAALAWFTGRADPDTSKWGKADLFWVNAVGTTLGYSRIPSQGIGVIDTKAPPPAAVGSIGPGGVPATPNVPNAPQPVATQPAMPTGPAAEAAQYLLAQMGIPSTPDMVRAVQAWIATENGGNPKTAKLDGNNPFGIHTLGGADLPGQAGKTADGTAIFNTWQDGVIAAARDLQSNHPDILSAFRTGDPETALNSLSQITRDVGEVVQVHNKLPGARTIIGGVPKLLTTPADLAKLAYKYPDVADLFAIDPRDPAQKDWFDQNLASMKNAAEGGKSKFEFITTSGKAVTLDFDSNYYGDLLEANVGYVQVQNPGPNASPADQATWRDKVVKASEDRMKFGGVQMSQWQDHIDILDKARQYALSHNDLATYLNLTMDMHADTLAFGQSPYLVQDQKDKLQTELDSLSPKVNYADDPTAYNDKGDPILQHVAAGDIVPTGRTQDGHYVGVALPPDKGFVTQNPDGTPVIKWASDTPGLFSTVNSTNVDASGQPVPAPAYTQSYQHIVINGADLWLPSVQAGIKVSVMYGDPAGYRAPQGTTQGSGPRQFVPNVEPQDTQARLGTKIDLPAYLYVDPVTHQRSYYTSIDGGATWLDYSEDAIKAPRGPQIFLNPGANAGFDKGTLYIGLGDQRHPYDPVQDAGTISNWAHWAGQDRNDQVAPGSQGTNGGYLPLKTGIPSKFGGIVIDGTTTTDDLWNMGNLTPEQYRARIRAEGPQDELSPNADRNALLNPDYAHSVQPFAGRPGPGDEGTPNADRLALLGNSPVAWRPQTGDPGSATFGGPTVGIGVTSAANLGRTEADARTILAAQERSRLEAQQAARTAAAVQQSTRTRIASTTITPTTRIHTTRPTPITDSVDRHPNVPPVTTQPVTTINPVTSRPNAGSTPGASHGGGTQGPL